MAKLTGRAKLHDDDHGDEVYITTAFELVDGTGQVTIGDDAGNVLPTGRLISRDRGVRRVVHHVIVESRRANGRLRPPTPAPKPGCKTIQARQDVKGNCLKCGGTEWYESVDGTWQECDWCQHRSSDVAPE